MKIKKLEQTNVQELKEKVITMAQFNQALVDEVSNCDDLQALGEKFSDWEEALFFAAHCMATHYSIERAQNDKTCVFCERDRVEEIVRCDLYGSACKAGIRTFTKMGRFETGVGTVCTEWH